MARKWVTGPEFFRALEAAGVISDLDSITRVIIDVRPGEMVQLYVQRVAGQPLKEVAGLLGEMMRDGGAAVAGEAPEPSKVLEG